MREEYKKVLNSFDFDIKTKHLIYVLDDTTKYVGVEDYQSEDFAVGLSLTEQEWFVWALEHLELNGFYKKCLFQNLESKGNIISVIENIFGIKIDKEHTYTLYAYRRDDDKQEFKIDFVDKELALKVADLLVNDWCIIVDDNDTCQEIY